MKMEKLSTSEMVLSPVQAGFASDGILWNFPVTFKNTLYDMAADVKSGLRVIRSKDGLHWELASVPMQEDGRYFIAMNAIEYQDQLYISLIQDRCTDPQIMTPGLIMRTKDGIAWEKVFQTQEGVEFTPSLGQLGVYNEALYISEVVGFGQHGTSRLWRSTSGDPGTWEMMTPVFGNNTYLTSEIATYHGEAFLTSIDDDGAHIWHSKDGVDWQKTGEAELHDPAFSDWMPTAPVTYGDALYVGTNAWFFFLGNMLSGYAPSSYRGGQLYRSRDGNQWERVMAHGFRETQHSSGIDCLIVYDSRLHAFSNDMASDWSASTVLVWNSLTGNPGGWTQVSPEGLGPNTLATKSDLTVFQGDLYVGSQFGSGQTIGLYKMGSS
jgi:hypothetical protein